MPEVIDLTLDSPAPKESADDDESRARKKERRAERKEEKRESRRQRKRDSRRKHRDEPDREERDPDEERRSHRSRDEKDDGKRRRESSRERDSDRKRSRRERERDIPNDELFVLDATPAVLPAAARYIAATTVEEPSELILPAHVSVFGETPAPILPTEPLDSDEEDYIEYLDYDNRKVRLLSRSCRWPLLNICRTSFATTRSNLKKSEPKSYAKNAGRKVMQPRSALS